MSEILELIIDKLNNVADETPQEYYHQVVKSLTSDAAHAATHINPEDLKILANFAEDVRILQKRDKEK